MNRRTALVLCLSVSGCGRFSFDPRAPDDAGDGSDASVADTAIEIDAAIPASCLSLPPTCGPTGASSCCESTLVTGGSFFRTYDGVGNNDMTAPATVASFRLDRYEVTVGRFRQYVLAGRGTQQNLPAPGDGAHPQLPGTGWDASFNGNLPLNTAALIGGLHCNQTREHWTDAAGANENLPINCVSWFDAMAFCAWDGGFVPSEAEWNYAASGGDEQRAYPWSSPAASLTITCSHANHYDGANQCLNPPNGAADRVGNRSPAGDGRWGHSDLGGNVWEWTLDTWIGTYQTPCTDCVQLAASSARTARGAAYYDTPFVLRGAFRNNLNPTGRMYGYGIRCARAP